MMMNAQNFKPANVSNEPFAHAVVDGFLDADFYEALEASFPGCKPGSGPTGYTCFRGDPEYDALLKIPEWRALHDKVHSQAFVDYMLATFADVYARHAVHDLSNARYVDYVEDRTDKEARNLRKVEHAPDELYVRMDVMEGRMGYDRGVHLDHRRRVGTLLLYCCDADEIGMVGGDLQLHDAKRQVAQSFRSRKNRAAMFPCYNQSWHSVSPITHTDRPRRFVQLTLSSSVDLWEPLKGRNTVKPPIWKRALRKAKGLVSA